MKKILLTGTTLLAGVLTGCKQNEASAIGIIGGADGPTAIFVTTKVADYILPAIICGAVVAIIVTVVILVKRKKK